MECQYFTDHGIQAGMAGVLEEAEALAGVGVEALAEAGSAGAVVMAEAGAGGHTLQAGQAPIGVRPMALFTGRIISEERRCLICQD